MKLDESTTFKVLKALPRNVLESLVHDVLAERKWYFMNKSEVIARIASRVELDLTATFKPKEK